MTREQSELIKNAKILFGPQPGGQTLFLQSPADFILYGGQAGGGKTYGTLLRGLRYYKVSGFQKVVFRRELKQVKISGGLWDKSFDIYPHFGGVPNLSELLWTFESGATIKFEGLSTEHDKTNHQGGEYCEIDFDELTHFSKTQFTYLFTRNRSVCGAPRTVAGTCNPDPDSWVREFVEWYLLPSGTPDHEKRGHIRYWSQYKDNFVFGDTAEYIESRYGIPAKDCKSYTFIYATLDDNPALLKKDPSYIANLKLAGEAESAALLSGNWNIRRSGKIFKREDFGIFTQTPQYTKKIIVMDTAQKTKEANDFSVMQCWIKSAKGIYLIDQCRGKWEFPDLELMATAFIAKHGLDLNGIYIEDAVSGTALIQTLRRTIKKPFTPIVRKKDKYTRAFDSQGYVKSGYVFINPMLDYFIDYTNEMVAFSADGSHAHDDQADCTFDAIDILLASANDEIISRTDNLHPSLSRIC